MMGDLRVQAFEIRTPEEEPTWHAQDGHDEADTKDYIQYSVATIDISSPDVNPSLSTVFKQ